MVIKAGWVVTRLEGNVYERSWSAAKVWQMTVGSIARYRVELLTSFQAAAVAATLGLILIVALHWVLRKQPWGRNPGLWLAVAMLIVPGPVLGLWLISVFNHPALTWLHPLYDRSLVVIELAQMLRGWPWMWGIVAVTFSTVGRGQLEQAELEGASSWHIVRRILWPQLWPSWLLAWLLGFELALGELAATILVTPPGITPLSVRLFTLLHSDYEAEVAGLCLLLILLHAAGSVSSVGCWHTILRSLPSSNQPREGYSDYARVESRSGGFLLRSIFNRSWNDMKLSVACLFAAVVFLATTAHAIETVRFNRQNQPQTVAGRLVLKAADGGLLIQSNDGRIWTLQPEEIVSHTTDAKPFVPLKPAEIARQVQRELGPGFSVHTTVNYVLVYNTTKTYAQWVGGCLNDYKMGSTPTGTSSGSRHRSPSFRSWCSSLTASIATAATPSKTCKATHAPSWRTTTKPATA